MLQPPDTQVLSNGVDAIVTCSESQGAAVHVPPLCVRCPYSLVYTVDTCVSCRHMNAKPGLTVSTELKHKKKKKNMRPAAF